MGSAFRGAVQCTRKLDEKLEEANERNMLVISKLDTNMDQVQKHLEEASKENQALVGMSEDLKGHIKQLSRVNDERVKVSDLRREN